MEPPAVERAAAEPAAVERAEQAGAVVIRLDAADAGDDPCERLREALRSAEPAPYEVVCDVGGLTRTDMATLDLLLRMQLTARRLGHEIRLYRPNAELVRLLEMIGLADTLPLHGS